MKRYVLSELRESEAAGLLRRNPFREREIMDTCRNIFDAVQREGDEAVSRFTGRFDGARLENFRVSDAEMREARGEVAPRTLDALRRAADNIRAFHKTQAWEEPRVEIEAGVECWRETRAIGRVGLYVPAGTAPLPSTVLMLGVPARVAGCREVVICVPPREDGGVPPQVLAAAEIVDADEVLKIGGAQAIAAMALGTESVLAVDKIFGPGNRWVQAAKLLAFQYGIAVDLPAGPSEVLVVADQGADASFVAADLLAQAEHGFDSQVVLASDSASLIDRVEKEIENQIDALPRANSARGALAQSFSILCADSGEAIRFANLYAPEHLILNMEDARKWARRVESAGSVFLGPWTPEVAGDYASGTNHALPTSGAARAFSGVSLDSFVKKITFQRLEKSGLESLAPTLEELARVEGLEAHRRAVAARLGRP